MSLEKFIGHDDIVKLINLYAPLNGEDVSIYNIRSMLNEHDEYLKEYMDERLQNNQHIRASDNPVLYVFDSSLEVTSGYGGSDSTETYSITANRSGTIRVKAVACNSRDAYAETCTMVVYVNDVGSGATSAKYETATEIYCDVNVVKGDVIKVGLSCGAGIQNTLTDIKICGTLDLGSTLFEEVTE